MEMVGLVVSGAISALGSLQGDPTDMTNSGRKAACRDFGSHEPSGCAGLGRGGLDRAQQALYRGRGW